MLLTQLTRKRRKSLPELDPSNGTEVLSSRATLRSDNQEMSKEELRRQHQAELARQKNEETARWLACGGSEAAEGRGPVRTSSELIASKNVNDFLLQGTSNTSRSEE